MKNISHEIILKVNYILLGSHNPDSITLYIVLNDKIEKASELLDIILIQITVPIMLITYLVRSMTNYYIFDWGEGSFNLPCPIW